ncbi:MAG: hypothetical protein J7L11_08765 [Thermoprotei archaeon]|nr:hypothetical protein [Thermoprotei archaeon]
MVWDISVAYYGCQYPNHIEGDLKEISEAGFTSITLCINEREWPRLAKAKKFIVDRAHDLGLRVFIDVHGFGFFVPGHFSIAVPRNPEWCEVDNKGRIYPIRGCPNNPNYRKWLKERVREMVDRLKPDGVFWDEPSFIAPRDWPEAWTCRCPACRKAFREEYGYEMPNTLTRDIREFRQKSVFGFLDELTSEVRELDEGLLNILCLMPEHTGRHGIYSWDPVLKLKNLDVFSTDPYWIWSNRPFDWFVEWVKRAIGVSKKANLKSQIWVELIRIPRKRESDIRRSVIKAVELGADAIATWSFRAEEGSELSCEDPETAWKTMIEAIKEVRGIVPKRK